MDSRAEKTRCGECRKCRDMYRVQLSVIRAINAAGKTDADRDGIVELWNAELTRLACERMGPKNAKL